MQVVTEKHLLYQFDHPDYPYAGELAVQTFPRYYSAEHFRVYGHGCSKVVTRDRHSLGHVSEVLLPFLVILKDTPDTIVVVLLAIVVVTGLVVL